MASLVNPFGLVPLDVIYYFLLLVLGPCFFCYLLIFQGLRRELLEEYLWDGKEHLGIITHVRIGKKEGHSIRYAYKAKDYSSTKKSQIIYYKDWTPVDDLERRLIVVTVLPDKPDSGVPKSLVLQRKSWLKGGMAVQVAYATSLAAMAVAIIVAASLLSQLPADCSEDDDCFPGDPSTIQYATAALLVPALGCWLAYLADLTIRKRGIPGSVWKIQDCQEPEEDTGDCQLSEGNNSNDPEATVGPSAASPPRVTWQQYQTMDDRSEIPEEEIVGVLGGVETEDDDDHAREALATLKILSAEQMISNDRYREDPSQTEWDQRTVLPLVLVFSAVVGGLSVLMLGS